MIKRKLKDIETMVNGKISSDDYIEIYIEGVSTDTRTITEGQLFVPIKGDRFNGHNFIESAINNGAKAALWSRHEPLPEIDFPLILVEDTLHAIQKLAKEYRNQLSIKIIGITGSNGKTSTKDILSSILETQYKTYKTHGNLNNHLGVPLTLLSIKEDTEMGVIEMGMSSLGEIELLSNIASPDVAIITNIGNAHLEELKTRDNIIKAKLEIVKGLKPNGLFVYHGDDNDLKETVNKLDIHQKKITFGEKQSNDYSTKIVSNNKEGLHFKLDNKPLTTFYLPMLGKHQIFNATAAICVARYFDISYASIKKGLKNVSLTGMRNELIKGKNFDILNDSYNANPESTKAALRTIYSLKGYTQKIVIFADMLELGDKEKELHKEIGRCIDFDNIDFLFTYGKLSKYTSKEAQLKGYSDKSISFMNKKELIKYLKRILKSNSLILLKGSRGMHLEEIADSLLKEE